jgi:hypothetical protein
MKCQKQGWLFLLFIMVLLLPTASFAEDAATTVKKSEETVGRVVLESKEYPLDHYRIEADIGDSIMEAGDRALHAINQGIWGFNKTISQFTLYSINQLMSFDLISSIVDEAGMMSERIYEIMSGTFLSLFVVIVGGTAAWRYFVNQQVGHAVKAIIGALAIMSLTFWFYSNATEHIKWLNGTGAQLEGIASSANVLVSSDEFDSNAAYDPQEGIAVLENQLFNLMVKRPYLLLNYGSTKESDIVSEDPNRVDKLLAVKPYTQEGKEARKIIINDEVSNFDNKQMSSEYSGERFGYLLVTILSTIALSIPVLLLGIFKFLLQVWFLALVIFTAIPLVFSLIPSYSETALNHGKKLVGVLLMKAGLVLLIAVITGLVTLLYESVRVTSGVEGYAFVVFLIVITIWGLFKYRSEIFEVASVGMIQGQQAVERTTSIAFDRMNDVGEKGFRGARRMIGQTYQSHRRKGDQDESGSRQEGFVRGRLSASANGSPGFTAGTGHQSQQRQVIGHPTGGSSNNGNGAALIGSTRSKGKDSKATSETKLSGSSEGMARSASRNAGAAIVDLDHYKKGKGTSDKTSEPFRTSNNATQKPLESQKRNANPNFARKPNIPSENRNQSSNRTASEAPGAHNGSESRNLLKRSEEKTSRPHKIDPDKPITKWEANQQIEQRKGNPSHHTYRSSKRGVTEKEKTKRQTEKPKHRR